MSDTNSEELKKVIDLQNDKITQTLDKFIKVLMDNLTYKN